MRLSVIFTITFLLLSSYYVPAQSIVKLMVQQPGELKAGVPQRISADQSFSIDLGDSLVVTGGTPPYLYSWKSGQSVLSENRAFEITPTRIPSSYTIQVVDSRNCSAENLVSVLVGVQEVSTFPVKVYPVPATSYIVIDAEPVNFIQGMATLYDISGQKRIEQALSGKTILPLQLPAGIYLLEINISGQISTRKIIISGRN